MRRGLETAAAVLLLSSSGCGGGGGQPRPAIDLSAVAPATETYTDADLAHLAFVLSEEQQNRYRTLDADGRRSLLRVAWAELDPTPTSPLNERRNEHYRRLGYVREHFAIEAEPGWDRRGELLLRYGAPDDRRIVWADVVENVGVIPPKEIWVYRALGQAYQLEDPRLQGVFRDSYDVAVDLGASPRDYRRSRDEREELDNPTVGYRAERQDLDDVPDAEAQLQASKLSSLLARGQEAYREKPQAYLHDYGGTRLDVVFDVLNFWNGDSGKTHVQVNTAYWSKDLGYAPEGDGWEAVIGVEAVVKTMEYEVVARRDQVSRDRKSSIDDLKGRLTLGQVGFDLEPGHFRLALSVRDSVSRRVGIYTTDFWVRPFPAGEMRLSDVQRALDVESGQPGDPFLRGPLQVVPYPLGTFPRGRDIYLYFEAYGLAVSPDGDSLYEVDFLIRPRTGEAPRWFGSSRGQVVPGIASTFPGSGNSSTVREYIVFDPSAFIEDIYDVEITVRDLIDERTTTGSISFGVQGQ